MVNKLWYQKSLIDGMWYDEDDEELIIARNYIQKFIDLYCSNYDQYNVVEDITPENLGKFLEKVLINYQLYNFSSSALFDLASSLHLYFHRAYMDEFPDTCYPNYPNNDKRNLAMNIIDLMEAASEYTLLPEDVPYLIAYLGTSDNNIEEAYMKMVDYFEQFDNTQRFKLETTKRWEAICRERLDAIQNNQPIPIRPMTIELSMCYKKHSQAR